MPFWEAMMSGVSKDNAYLDGLLGSLNNTGGTMNAIGCNQVEPDFAVTIPHPPKKARNLNDYKGTTLGELIDLLEHSWEQRDRMGKQRDEAEKKAERVVNELHNVLGQRDKAEKKCEAQAKRIRELEDGLAPATDRILAHQKEIAEQLLKRMELHEQVNRLKEELATHKKDIAYARETVEIANSTIIRQHDQINGLGDINIAQAAELSKLREQLKAQQANQELVVNVTAKVTGLDELQELTHRLAHYERLTRAAK